MRSLDFRHSLRTDQRLRAEAAQEQAEARFRAAGGRHWEARQERVARQGELKSRVAGLESRLLALSAGALPLALVPDLLDRVGRHDALECRAAEAAVVQAILAERDEALVRRLEQAGSGVKTLKLVRDHLEADRRGRQAPPAADRLGLSEGARSLLGHLAGRGL